MQGEKRQNGVAARKKKEGIVLLGTDKIGQRDYFFYKWCQFRLA